VERERDKGGARETRYKQQEYIPVVCTNNRNILLLFVRHKSWYSAVSLGRCSVFPSRVGIRTYQHPDKRV